MEKDSPSTKQPNIVVMTSPRRSWTQFFSATLRLALALTLAACFCGIVVGVVWGIYQWREAKIALPLEASKEWAPKSTVPQMGGGVAKLKTKLVSEFLHYHLEAEVTPLGHATLFDSDNVDYVILSFVDKDGFNRFSKEIPLSDFTLVVNTNGLATGISVDQSTYCSADLYQSFSEWGIGWRKR